MNKNVLRSASILLALVLVFVNFIPGRATSQNATFMPDKLINLSHFYKPPTNSTASAVAGNFSNVILTGGDENFRDQLAANGLTSAVAQYFRAEGIQDPGSCTASPANNQIAYKVGDFCNISRDHPDWFLLDTNGNRMRTSPTSNYYRMDPGNAGWRQFFLSRLMEMNQQKGWSGVFLDNLEAGLSEIQRDGLTPAKYPDTLSYQAAVRGFIQYLYVNYAQPYNRPLLANIISRSDEAIWLNYIQYLSGAMQERWAVGWDSPDYVSESKWLGDLALAEKTQAQGKFIILMAQGDQTDLNRQKFSFASYLLVTNGKAAFRYGNEDVYNQVWLYDNYKVQLGTPLGARYKTGTNWRRDFTNGYVLVDPIAHTATIATTTTTAPTFTPVVTKTATVVVATSTATKLPTLAASKTPTKLPTLAATKTPTKLPTLAVTNTATRLPTLAVSSTPTKVPTLAVTNTVTKAPTLAVTSTPTKVPTLAVTNTPTTLPTMTSTPAPVNLVYDDKSTDLVYSEGWSEVTEPQAYRGGFKETHDVGSYVTLSFTGQTFSILYRTGPNLGNMEVYLDGVLITTIDQKSPSPSLQQKWSYNGTLAPGTHTLKLVSVGPSGGRISLDAISVP